MVDSDGKTWANNYDVYSNQSSESDALSNVTSYTYDGAGNRLTQTTRVATARPFHRPAAPPVTYDLANQLKTITCSDGVTPTACGNSSQSHCASSPGRCGISMAGRPFTRHRLHNAAVAGSDAAPR